jgi:hypothetical protein
MLCKAISARNSIFTMSMHVIDSHYIDTKTIEEFFFTHHRIAGWLLSVCMKKSSASCLNIPKMELIT